MPLRILRIALDTHETHVEELPAEIEQLVLGGRGAATWWLTHRLPPNTGPLSPANPLIFSAGTLAGMGLPATGGFVVSTRSPLTRLIAHSWGHGGWGNALRRAGFDLLVLEGQSSAWCVLQIDDGAVQFLPADDVAGSDTRITNSTSLNSWVKTTVLPASARPARPALPMVALSQKVRILPSRPAPARLWRTSA